MKRVLIIGASSGIGKELALRYALDGYTVGITARRRAELETIQKVYPNSIQYNAMDITHPNAIEQLNTFANKLGGFDQLIFCAGTGELNEALDLQLEETTNTLNIGAFTKVMNWAYHHFEGHKGGKLVAISSIGGLRGSRIAPAYNASKAYQINYLEGLRQKSAKAKNNIVVIDIRPGLVDTAMAKGEGLFWVMPTSKAASQIYKKIEQNSSVAYVTKRWKWVAKILKIIPTWVYDKM